MRQLSKQEIKLLRSLSLKKYRKQHALFVAEGARLVQELLGSHLTPVKVFHTREWHGAQKSGSAEAIEISEDDMARISQLATPSSVAALVPLPDNILQNYVPEPLSLLCEDIQDPGNLGTIVRIADWYGLKQVFCSTGCTDIFGPKAIQATMGSIARIKVAYGDIAAVAPLFATLAATDVQGGSSVHTAVGLATPLGLTIGNEGKGLKPQTRRLCNQVLHIPAYGQAESLNAAVAAAISLDNLRRLGY